MASVLEAELRQDFPREKGESPPVPVFLAYVESWLSDAEHRLSLENRPDAAAAVRELRERFVLRNGAREPRSTAAEECADRSSKREDDDEPTGS
jgi:hypothetical protein